MKEKKFSETSTEELQRTKKTLQTITGILLGALIVLIALSLYITFTKGFTALLIIPLALLPIAILNFLTVKKINKEIESRKKA